MGQIAVITSGTAGIGLACARTLLESGGTVVMSGRSTERGHRAMAELGAGDRARYIQCDVTDPNQVSQPIEDTAADYRRNDVLVNNASGVTDEGKPIRELDNDALNRAFTPNVNSAF